MSITVEDRIDAIQLEDIKEQIATLGDDKYLRLLEKEAYKVEDIALTALNFLSTHRKVLEVMKKCSSKHNTQTKPQKNN
ncbi:hypothetical protein EDI_010060 [Entamoeba dispar SAW760]|uniref:Uncharacterized protein n=1 Tax=Entamoeba dispar (strain ATCC PRA-260 / SAW760) TaxID=370354 RepID=B0ENC5_ENTDS|nr:uncharacterized protein EDI_010060 [Entamoeba dispar SAW760]EDR23963.1 hypothetical protein EDI_010060 [Entamoeba dispar SAW760]|eukprot:EDR23963.1 hypothetical protein EDI_010060 [Entamoeba dispar SAW760]